MQAVRTDPGTAVMTGIGEPSPGADDQPTRVVFGLPSNFADMTDDEIDALAEKFDAALHAAIPKSAIGPS